MFLLFFKIKAQMYKRVLKISRILRGVADFFLIKNAKVKFELLILYSCVSQ